jgi:serine/threonine-protein kinase
MAQTTALLGSPRYMSPEQIRNSTQVDGRADIWAMGCVLYELLAAHPAFDAPSIMELGAAILGDDPVPVRVLASHVSVELDAIVMRCLQKRPELRFQNVAELAAALYPFGPRRARMFAERCHSLLQCVHPELAKLELLSISPPSSMATTFDVAAMAKLSAGAPKPANKGKRAMVALVVTAAAVVGGIYVASPQALQSKNLGALATSIQEELSQPPAVAEPTALVTPDVQAAREATRLDTSPTAHSSLGATGAVNQSATGASAASAAASMASPDVDVAPGRPRARASWRAPAAAKPATSAVPAKVAPSEPDVGF